MDTYIFYYYNLSNSYPSISQIRDSINVQSYRVVQDAKIKMSGQEKQEENFVIYLYDNVNNNIVSSNNVEHSMKSYMYETNANNVFSAFNITPANFSVRVSDLSHIVNENMGALSSGGNVGVEEAIEAFMSFYPRVEHDNNFVIVGGGSVVDNVGALDIGEDNSYGEQFLISYDKDSSALKVSVSLSSDNESINQVLDSFKQISRVFDRFRSSVDRDTFYRVVEDSNYVFIDDDYDVNVFDAGWVFASQLVDEVNKAVDIVSNNDFSSVSDDVDYLFSRIHTLSYILGVDIFDNVSDSGVDEDLIRELVLKRDVARENKDWAEADAIRDKLNSMGVKVIDSSDGSRWEYFLKR